MSACIAPVGKSAISLPLGSIADRFPGAELASFLAPLRCAARAQTIAARGLSVINLGIDQPDFPTPPHIVEAACRALTDGHHGYTAASGIPELREVIAADAERRCGIRAFPSTSR